MGHDACVKEEKGKRGLGNDECVGHACTKYCLNNILLYYFVFVLFFCPSVSHSRPCTPHAHPLQPLNFSPASVCRMTKKYPFKALEKNLPEKKTFRKKPKPCPSVCPMIFFSKKKEAERLGEIAPGTRETGGGRGEGGREGGRGGREGGRAGGQEGGRREGEREGERERKKERGRSRTRESERECV